MNITDVHAVTGHSGVILQRILYDSVQLNEIIIIHILSVYSNTKSQTLQITFSIAAIFDIMLLNPVVQNSHTYSSTVRK